MTRKRARELVRGDVVEVDGGPVELIGEPFLGCSGASVLDSFQLFLRARVRALDASRREFVMTWDLTEPVRLASAPQTTGRSIG